MECSRRLEKAGVTARTGFLGTRIRKLQCLPVFRLLCVREVKLRIVSYLLRTSYMKHIHIYIHANFTYKIFITVVRSRHKRVDLLAQGRQIARVLPVLDQVGREEPAGESGLGERKSEGDSTRETESKIQTQVQTQTQIQRERDRDRDRERKTERPASRNLPSACHPVACPPTATPRL